MLTAESSILFSESLNLATDPKSTWQGITWYEVAQNLAHFLYALYLRQI